MNNPAPIFEHIDDVRYCISCSNPRAAKGGLFCAKCEHELVAVCVCGRHYDRELWLELGLVAVSGSLQPKHSVAEARRCECGRQLVREIDRHEMRERVARYTDTACQSLFGRGVA